MAPHSGCFLYGDGEGSPRPCTMQPERRVFERMLSPWKAGPMDRPGSAVAILSSHPRDGALRLGAAGSEARLPVSLFTSRHRRRYWDRRLENESSADLIP